MTGKYNANDVDILLLKVRNDYEECLKEQRERIMAMRDENRELKMQLKQFKENEQYIIGAIARADETAKSIILDAQAQAAEIVDQARAAEKQISLAAAGCYQKLCRLKAASAEIYRAVSKTVGEQEITERAASNVRPFIGVYESTHS
jgi:cell division septum initiation protein DivIVA